MSPKIHSQDPPEPDTETIDRAIRKRRNKQLGVFVAIFAIIGSLGAAWAIVAKSVDLTRVPERLDAEIKARLDAERTESDARLASEQLMRERLSAIEARQQDEKESLARIERALRIAPPKQKDEP